MKCVLFLVGVALLQVTQIFCDISPNTFEECSIVTLTPIGKLKELRKKAKQQHCRHANRWNKTGVFKDDGNTVNEKKLRQMLAQTIKDSDKLDELTKIKMECATKYKDVKKRCEFIATVNMCSKILMKNNSKLKNDDEEEE